MPTRTFSHLIAEARRSDAYQDEWAVSDFTEELNRRMEELGLSRAALAAKIGASPPYITKVLRGDANFTIRSLTKLARAVESVLRLHLAPVGSVTVWKDEIVGQLEPVSPALNENAVVTFPGRALRPRVELNAADATAAGGSR